MVYKVGGDIYPFRHLYIKTEAVATEEHMTGPRSFWAQLYGLCNDPQEAAYLCNCSVIC